MTAARRNALAALEVANVLEAERQGIDVPPATKESAIDRYLASPLWPEDLGYDIEEKGRRLWPR